MRDQGKIPMETRTRVHMSLEEAKDLSQALVLEAMTRTDDGPIDLTAIILRCCPNVVVEEYQVPVVEMQTSTEEDT